MFQKIVTILIAILLCCATLLSCNYSVDVPTQEDIDFDKINGNYIVSNTDNIVKLDTEYYKGVEIKKVLDDSMDPLVVYLTNDQLDKIKNTYSEDALSLINFSDEEVHDIFKLNQLRADIKNNKEYIFAHYNSNRKIVDNYSYIYYIIYHKTLKVKGQRKIYALPVVATKRRSQHFYIRRFLIPSASNCSRYSGVSARSPLLNFCIMPCSSEYFSLMKLKSDDRIDLLIVTFSTVSFRSLVKAA